MGVRAPGAGGAGGSRAVAPRHGAAAVAAGAPELGYKAEHAPTPPPTGSAFCLPAAALRWSRDVIEAELQGADEINARGRNSSARNETARLMRTPAKQ